MSDISQLNPQSTFLYHPKALLPDLASLMNQTIQVS